MRIADLRIVLDRDDQTRVSIDGAELLRASSAAEALRFIADHLDRVPAHEQLDALTNAIVGAT